MQRLVEQPVDNGLVFEGRVPLGRVHYHLAVYQYFADSGADSVPANLEIEGRITGLDALDVATLPRRESELTLQLADGRLLDFLVHNDKGTIRSTGRGLYLQ